MILLKKDIQIDYFYSWIKENYQNFLELKVSENDIEINFSSNISSQDETTISSFYDALSPNDGKKYKLKIEDFIFTDDRNLIKIIDYTICGLTKCFPMYDKGRRTSSSFFDTVEAQNVVVKKLYEDVYKNGVIEMIKVTHQWFDINNNVGLSKTTYIPYSAMELEDLLSSRRSMQIHYLNTDLVGTMHEANFATLLDNYAYQISEYVKTGGTLLKDSIFAETDPAIITLLDTVVGSMNGQAADWTMRDKILYQIIPEYSVDTKTSILNS